LRPFEDQDQRMHPPIPPLDYVHAFMILLDDSLPFPFLSHSTSSDHSSSSSCFIIRSTHYDPAHGSTFDSQSAFRTAVIILAASKSSSLSLSISLSRCLGVSILRTSFLTLPSLNFMLMLVCVLYYPDPRSPPPRFFLSPLFLMKLGRLLWAF